MVRLTDHANMTLAVYCGRKTQNIISFEQLGHGLIIHGDLFQCKYPGPEVIKNFLLNSAEHETLKAHRYKHIKNLAFFRIK